MSKRVCVGVMGVRASVFGSKSKYERERERENESESDSKRDR